MIQHEMRAKFGISLSNRAVLFDWATMDEITDPVAIAALTETYVEIGRGDDLTIAITAPEGTTDLVIQNTGVLVDSTGALGVLLIREYILAFESLEQRQEAWEGFRSDPEWHRVRDKSEANGPIVARVMNTILKPTDYSPLQ